MVPSTGTRLVTDADHRRDFAMVEPTSFGVIGGNSRADQRFPSAHGSELDEDRH
jgi:hypothetical protein